jgi:hypothetical protein
MKVIYKENCDNRSFALLESLCCTYMATGLLVLQFFRKRSLCVKRIYSMRSSSNICQICSNSYSVETSLFYPYWKI